MLSSADKRGGCLREHAVDLRRAAGHQADGLRRRERAVAHPVQQTPAFERGVPLDFAAGVVRDVFVLQHFKAGVRGGFQSLDAGERWGGTRHMSHDTCHAYLSDGAHIRKPVRYVDAVDRFMVRAYAAVIPAHIVTISQ